MSRIMEKTILLSFHQLLLLMCKMEIEDILLPEEVSKLSADERQLKEAFAELINDKYIISGAGDKYVMSAEIRRIMEVISESVSTYVISEEKRKFNPVYLYRQNLDCVCLSIDEHHPGWIKLVFGDFGEKFKSFSDYKPAKIKIEKFTRGINEIQKSYIVDAEEIDIVLEENHGFS